MIEKHDSFDIWCLFISKLTQGRRVLSNKVEFQRTAELSVLFELEPPNS